MNGIDGFRMGFVTGLWAWALIFSCTFSSMYTFVYFLLLN